MSMYDRFMKLQINLVNYKYEMSEQLFDLDRAHQELYDLLNGIEKNINPLETRRQPTQSRVAQIIDRHQRGKAQYHTQNQRNYLELQSVESTIQAAFNPLVTYIKSPPNLQPNIDNNNRLEDMYKKIIEQKDVEIKSKLDIIDSLRVELQTRERQMSEMGESYKLQLAKKDRINLILQTKQEKCKNSLKELQTKIMYLRRELQDLKLNRDKQNSYKHEQEAIMSHFRRIVAKNRVEINEQLQKQKEQVIQKINRVYAQLQIQQRDISRLAGFSIDEQLPLQDKLKKFYQQLKLYVNSSNVFSDSDIIQDISEKDWLMKRVSEAIGGKSFKTRLIFKLDEFNKTNFHKYIDKRPNIMLLVKLTCGYVIGGFCKTPIDKQKVEKHKDGFLFSLSLRQKYEPKGSNQALVSYDDFFLIFGNSEIRIKSLQTKVYSNFGANSGVFNSNGKKVGDFLGEGKNETTLAHYQIYEITKQQM